MFEKLSTLGKSISQRHIVFSLTLLLIAPLSEVSGRSYFSFLGSQGYADSVQPTLELKNGYFFFTDSKMKNVYDRGGWDIQLSSSYPIWRCFQAYGSVEYLQRHGRSINEHQKTSIWEVPLSFGLKYVLNLCPSVQYYAALGPRYAFVHQHNCSCFVDKHINNNGIGGFVNGGFTFSSCGRFFVDVFGEYSFVRLCFHPEKQGVEGRRIQVGGLTFGAGVGYAY